MKKIGILVALVLIAGCGGGGGGSEGGDACVNYCDKACAKIAACLGGWPSGEVQVCSLTCQDVIDVNGTTQATCKYEGDSVLELSCNDLEHIIGLKSYSSKSTSEKYGERIALQSEYGVR